MKYIGRSLRRLEDRTLLLGRGEYAADLSAPGQLHMRVVRSSVAHGKLLAVHKSEARAHPGVHAVWSYDDVRHVPPIGIRLTRVGGLEPYQQTVLAKDEVRYVGEPAAVVFADDPYAAEDAAELVGIEIDELPAIVSPLEAPEAALIEKGYGDLAAAFAAAHAVIELEVAVGRHSGVPLETRGALAEFDPASGILTMKGAAKVPHYNRDQVARMLDLPADMVHLIEGHVGGGFGVRGELYPEDVLVCHAALRLKRSVKWIEDRFEHLIAANHSRDQIHRLRAAVDADGFVLGLEDEIFTDQGAYIRTHGVTVSDLACAMLPGPYIIPAYRARAHVRLTNKTPCGTYRAPGRYESTFARERLMDAVAARLRLDPMQVRRRNFIAPERMPFDRGVDTLGTRVVYDSGNYALLLDKLLARLDYPALKRQLADRRAQGEKVGLGIALFVEKSGLGPADKAVITLEAGGTVEIVTGAASIGQGIETVMAQICAEVLDIAPERMRVLHGRTDRIDHGMGAFASRVTVMTGCAVKAAAEALKEKMAHEQPPISAEGWFRSTHMNYPYGIHAAVVRVDPATCGVTVERFVVGCDIGRAVNPMLVEGQFTGGAAQGIGGALLEEFLYDAAGQPLATTFADYLLPTTAEVPPIEVLVTEDAPSPLNPLGVKGAGEGGINAAGAAIAAAVDDALGRPGAVTRLPITPQRLHRITLSAKEEHR
ncbi:MAG: xanthine dehydrogenase family protein molybdopterin-binding subunit [Betaproteobacteria bacterium]|nr:xanthine dehydrogenase family protein molybdopterin-binding subunit [Betaproteobacteria bacterium]